MALPETIAAPPPPATALRHRERRWLGWINPMPLAKGPLLARLGVGIVMLMHGLQKLGLFGGAGWSATIDTFVTKMHIPAPLAALVILTEVVGGALLILGLAARFAALAVTIEMIVAAFLVHVPNGFFMNWYMEPGRGHGFEMNLVLVALALVVLVEGAGRWALDSKIAHALAVSTEGQPPRTPSPSLR